MKSVAVFGLRGYGVIYSGYETFAKFLVTKSNKEQFFYHLFGRSRYKKYEQTNKGDNFQTIHVATAKGKHLETFTYNFTATFSSLFQGIDIVLYLGTANTLFIFIQKVLGRKIIVNTAGVDWKKKRWSFIGKLYLFLCEKLTVLFADIILCDSKTVMSYYKRTYHKKNLVYIPYGAEVTKREPSGLLQKLGIESNRYFYTVGRISPENCFEDIILAFRKVKTDFNCVIIGNSIYEDNYKNHLKKLAGNDDRIVFAGFQKEKNYEEICSNALSYIESKSIGGTHPSLLEAIAFGKPVIAKDIPENTEVIGDSAFLYQNNDLDSLSEMISYVIHNKNIAHKKTKQAKAILDSRYNWEEIIKNYEQQFHSLYE